jgi:type III secretion protein SpaR/YscT/HrcT
MLSTVAALEHWIWQIAVGFVRVAPAIYFLPCFNDKMMGGMIVRNSLIVLIAAALSPLIMTTPAATSSEILLIVIREFVIGLLLGLTFAAPLWAALTIGEIIDNQRGATVSSAIDPAVGVETSLLASFLNNVWTFYFLIAGGLLMVVQAIAASYSALPVNSSFVLSHATTIGVATMMGAAIAKGLLLAGPVVTTLFVTEVALGVLSRFAPQLNAFAVALSVKSFVAFCIMFIYFFKAVPLQLMEFLDPQLALKLMMK